MATDGITESTFSPSLTNKALEMLDSMEAAHDAPAQPAQVATPPETPAQTVETPATTAVETPATTTPVEPLSVSDDTPIKIKVNGEEKIVTAKEYQEILQRTDIWTQRMQAVAEQRKQLEQYAAEREAQILEAARAVQLARQELSQQNPLQQLQQLVQQQQQGGKELNPNEIATLGEVQAQLQALHQQYQQQLAQQQHQLQTEFRSQLQDAQTQAQIQRDRLKFTSAVQEMMQTEDGQLIKELAPEVEAAIRYNTLQLQPENVDQAIEFAKKVFAERVSKVKGRFTQQQTQSAVAQAKVVMEPPAGSPPALVQTPQKVALKPDGSINWDALRAKAMAIMDQ